MNQTICKVIIIAGVIVYFVFFGYGIYSCKKRKALHVFGILLESLAALLFILFAIYSWGVINDM